MKNNPFAIGTIYQFVHSPNISFVVLERVGTNTRKMMYKDCSFKLLDIWALKRRIESGVIAEVTS